MPSIGMARSGTFGSTRRYAFSAFSGAPQAGRVSHLQGRPGIANGMAGTRQEDLAALQGPPTEPVAAWTW